MDEAVRIAAFGATGTGKTAYVLQALARLAPARLMVWDFKSDHTLSHLGTACHTWPEFVRACRGPRFAARYLVSQDHDAHEQFSAFCALAWREGNVMVFVDELAEVTKANKAPGMWRKLVNVGRSYDNGRKSISIIGASQRPTEVDKSFLGNCDVIHSGRLGYANDAKMFASMWGIAPGELTNLSNLHWLEKRADAPGVERGVLTFGNTKTATSTKKTATKKAA
jgi:hypothetical protein